MINRRIAILAGAGAVGAAGLLGVDYLLREEAEAPPGLIDGVIWQVHEGMLDPHGEWDRLGAHTLMLQWIVANGTSFVPDLGLPTIADPPNWGRIAREPWAKSIIVGLAGGYDEPTARKNMAELAALSAQIARKPLPFRAAGYYFPVEVDPTWMDAPQMAPLLAPLPRPLWISAYDNSNIGGKPLIDWIDSWLPKDVGLMFQDGVGIHTRTPESARQYAEIMLERLGPSRFRLIAEAFRPAGGTALRPATLAELKPQLAAYRGIRTLVFDGPHYLDRKLVNGLLAG